MSMWFDDPNYRKLTTYNYGYLKAIKDVVEVINTEIKYLEITSVTAEILSIRIKKKLYKCVRKSGFSDAKIKELFLNDKNLIGE